MSGVLHARLGQELKNLMPGHVLVLENRAWFSEDFLSGLEGSSRQVTRVDTGVRALELIPELRPDLILVPDSLSDMSGVEFMQRLRDRGSDAGVLMVFGGDDLGRGAAALNVGSLDLLIQPYGVDQTVATLTLVAAVRNLHQQNQRLLSQLNELKSGDALIGRSPASRRLASVLARVAESSVASLIEGRPGSGKTLAAHIIHASGRRSERPLLIEQCAHLTPERLEQHLNDPHGGTLLLEDVEKLDPSAQSRVVRHIKERSSPTGAEGGLRILATTSAHLPELVARNRFREDLYYRLNVFPVAVPSLQERRDDIAVLAEYFLSEATERTGRPSQGFTPQALAMLEGHSWPGNIAQLQDAVERAHAVARGNPIDRHHLVGPTTGLVYETSPADVAAAQARQEEERVREEDVLPLETEERRLLARALKATKGNVRRAAQLLRIGRATLYRKIQVYDLKLN